MSTLLRKYYKQAKKQQNKKTGFCYALDHVVTWGLGEEFSFLCVLIVNGTVHLLKKKI